MDGVGSFVIERYRIRVHISDDKSRTGSININTGNFPMVPMIVSQGFRYKIMRDDFSEEK